MNEIFAGTIDVKEMVEILVNLYEMEGVAKVCLAKVELEMILLQQP